LSKNNQKAIMVSLWNACVELNPYMEPSRDIDNYPEIQRGIGNHPEIQTTT